MNLLAISGSLRAASTNSALTRAAAALAPDGVTVTQSELLDSLPHFSPDRDGDAAPDSAREWRTQVGVADGMLFVTPEYAFGIPGSLKNALGLAGHFRRAVAQAGRCRQRISVREGRRTRPRRPAADPERSGSGGCRGRLAVYRICQHQGIQRRCSHRRGDRRGTASVSGRAGAGCEDQIYLPCFTPFFLKEGLGGSM